MGEADRRARFEAWLHEHGAILHRVANGSAAGADRADLRRGLLLRGSQ
jgi:hypothetical protein